MNNKLIKYCIFIMVTTFSLAANSKAVYMTVPPVTSILNTVIKLKTVTMQETFKDIPDYEGIYQVSNLGRVKRLSRFIKNRANSGYYIKDKILSNSKLNNGYLKVGLKNKTKYIHQLMVITFLNHKPNGFKNLIVDHIDNNKLNNKLDNLQLITNRENSSKDKKNGSSKYVGVYWSKGNYKWRAMIWFNNKKYHIGYFKNEIDAHNAYQNKLLTLK